VSERTDVLRLSDWLDREVTNGATDIELHDPRSRTLLGMWQGGSRLDLADESVLALARKIVQSAEADLEELPKVAVLAVAPNETPSVVELARSRTVLVVARGLGGVATLPLAIDNAAEPDPKGPATVLRLTLRVLEAFAQLRESSPRRNDRWLLLERLVDILLANDERAERLAEQLQAEEIESLLQLLVEPGS
jgi:hypothetical protein